MNKFLLYTVLGLFTCITAWGQTPTKGKYYRVVNARTSRVIKENWDSYNVTCNNVDKQDFSQVWQYTASGALQNVYTARYLQDQPYGSTIYTTGKTAVEVKFTKQSDNHYLISTNGHYLHNDNGNNLVNWWDTSNEGNHWTVQEIALTADEVKAARAEYEELTTLRDNAGAYTETLKAFFTDELCTELQAEYASMADDALKAAMNEAGLPVALQDIAVKVKNQWWNDTEKSKYADKNKYAKDFRVASYQPYSDANNWRDKMNTYAPSFMGNPTGIYATNKDIIHVFVGSDIPEGATLYLTPLRNHGRIGSRSEGTQLKKGYNAVIATNDSLMYFVNYVVNTIPTSNVNAHTQTIAKISDFPELDIHIEGGECVGYYQKPIENSAEEDAKFQYLTKNAKKNMYFVVKGATSLFYFRQNTYTQVWPKTIWNSIDWFDKVHFWEFGLIGVLDDVANGLCESGTEHSKAAHPFNITGGDAFYPTYCNNPTMAIEGANGQNPHATTFYTSYPGTGGVESSFNAERANFDNWCVGHEHGHQIQAPYNLESCAESSVNLPSQLVTYMTGYRLGRGWSFGQHYNEYNGKGVPFGLRDISITMRMYWNLFLYYHVAGKKKDFYPTFVKSLREDPMDFSRDGVQYEHPEWGAPSGGHHRAINTWIKLYKKACDAAQEDLTEYFRLWGFFVPCDKTYFGDYTSYAVSLTQQEIDKAIAEVKAKNYPENLQIMFVEDRQILRERTDIWAHTATGQRKYRPTNWEEWYTQEQLTAEYGNVGDVLTYLDGSANTSSYTYIQSGNKITLKGKGGCGFIVYDLEGNNRYMSNTFKFEIPADVAANGFVIKAINADGTSSTVENAADSATDEEKLAILKTAIEASKEFTKLEDATGKKVGFYKSEDIATLKGLVEDANTAIKNSDVDNYMPLANAINNEILRLQTSGLEQKISPMAMYNIICVRKANDGTTRYLTCTTSTGELSTTTSANTNAARWAFVPTGEDGENRYYIQSRANAGMLGVALNEKDKIDRCVLTEATEEAACYFHIQPIGDGKFCVRPKDNTNLNMHNQGYTTVWGDADEGSQWYISMYEPFDEKTNEDFEELITYTQDLVNDVCVYEEVQSKYALQTTDASQPCYLSTNQPDAAATNNGIEKAIDGNRNTYFKSNASNNGNTTELHHVKIDLGKGKTSKNVQFYIYGHMSFNYATDITVYGSNNNTSWTKVGSAENMSTIYTTEVYKPSTAYRYWRIDVNNTNRKVTDLSPFPWFTLREFEMYETTATITKKAPFDKVTTITNTTISNCMTRIAEAQKQMNKSWRTPMGDFYAWFMLNNAYTTLYNRAAAVDPTVGIEGVEGENGEVKSEIFDLSGRKVKNTDNNGIYIVNGKKVVK
ncbi:MAG: M60 family metallopeptidase [Bacteroidaceae bacterium]|nr:M60 family metallopeptidase [Bacteroidaceae bacterium]